MNRVPTYLILMFAASAALLTSIVFSVFAEIFWASGALILAGLLGAAGMRAYYLEIKRRRFAAPPSRERRVNRRKWD